MPVFSRSPQYPQLSMQDFPAPLSQSMGAIWDDPNYATTALYAFGKRVHAQLTDDTKLTIEEMEARKGDLPIDIHPWMAGTSERAFNLRMEQTKREQERQKILDRAQTGFWATTAHLTTGLAASILDPVELGVSLVPGISAARYASMLEKATTTWGRLGVRTTAGAAGGLTGAVITEPFITMLAAERQDTYTMEDSLLNVAFGTIMGAGLHAAGGAIKDKWFRAPEGTSRALDNLAPETREDALRTAVHQVATGRNVDIEPLLQMDSRYSYMTGERVPDVPEGVGGAKLDNPIAVNKRLNARLETLATEIETNLAQRILSKAELKELQGEEATLTHAIRQAENRDLPSKKRKSFRHARARNRKRLAEVQERLATDTEARAERKTKLGEIDKAKKALESEEQPNLKEWPKVLRDMLDEELGEISTLNNRQKLQSLIDAGLRQNTRDNDVGSMPKAEADRLHQRVDAESGKDDEITLDEHLQYAEQVIDDVAKTVDIEDDLKAINDVIIEEQGNLAKIKTELANFRYCRSVNG